MLAEALAVAQRQSLLRAAVSEPNALFVPAFEEDVLWYSARRLMRSPGRNRPGVDDIRADEVADWPALFDDLLHRLAQGTYRPLALKPGRVAKRAGGWRPIRVAAVQDRLLQYAQLFYIEPVLEADAVPINYGARPGVDRHIALARVADEVARRGRWCAVMDVEDCFGSIRHSAIRRNFKRRLEGSVFWNGIGPMLDAWASGPGRGIAQGVPGSPAWLNCALNGLDHFLFDRTTIFAVRWIDDLVVLVDKRERALKCADDVQAHLRPLGLQLSRATSKTYVASVEDGFEFLGVRVSKTKKGEVQLTAIPERLRASENNIYSHPTVKRMKTAMAGWISAWGPYISDQRVLQALATFQTKTGHPYDLHWSRRPTKPRSPDWMLPKGMSGSSYWRGCQWNPCAGGRTWRGSAGPSAAASTPGGQPCR